LHRFFHERNEITAATDYDLLRASDNLLRVLFDIEKHSGYTAGKMVEACKSLNRYCTSHGIESDFGGGDLWEMAHYGYAELSAFVEDNAGTAPLETALLRVILSLLEYLNSVRALKRVKYVDVSDSVQREIRSYVNLALVVRFDAELPDSLDKMCVGDVHNMCESTWQKIAKGANAWSLLP